MLLSICIPTYNRVENLDDCLNSIKISYINYKKLNFEVCISDNGSVENPEPIIEKYKKLFKVKFNRNKKNLGFALNAIKTVDMAEGEYIYDTCPISLQSTTT